MTAKLLLVTEYPFPVVVIESDGIRFAIEIGPVQIPFKNVPVVDGLIELDKSVKLLVPV